MLFCDLLESLIIVFEENGRMQETFHCQHQMFLLNEISEVGVVPFLLPQWALPARHVELDFFLFFQQFFEGSQM